MYDPKCSYRSYLLTILLVVFAFNLVDRSALGLVLESIKSDLRLTDAQLGFLSGIAFALFYSLMGIPIARWADRGNRITIISLTTAMWSIMVGLCGMATSFMQLMLIRVGVGIGEAGCVPPAHSLIADYFSRAERPRAVGTYLQGQNLSLLIGYFAAGWLNEAYGWRRMFVLLGLPGLIMAALVRFTLSEPRFAKQAIAGCESAGMTPSPIETGTLSPAPPSMKETFLTLWENSTFRHLLCSCSMLCFFGYGITQWQAVFFVRSFGMKTGELGTWFALVYGLCGLIGTQWGGEWASRYAPNNERLQLRAMALANVGFNGVIWALVYCTHNYYVAFAFMAISTVGGTALNAPLFATIQSLVPQRMRAMSIAIVYLFSNLIGMGLGPLAAGVLSDALTPIFGVESLRYALLALCPGYVWVSWHFWRASSTVAGDLQTVQHIPHVDSGEKNVVIDGAV
jgi:MFS transporter, Spinster family, sphingosine-1-phosphate transporter